MKKLLILFFLSLLPLALLAQTDFPVPVDLTDVFTNLGIWVGTFTGVAGLTVLVTALVLKVFKVTGSGLKQLISWAMGFVLVVVLNLLQIGYAKDLLWYGVIAYGIAESFAANKMFDTGLLQSILEMLKLTKPAYHR